MYQRTDVSGKNRTKEQIKQRGSISGSKCKQDEAYMAMKIRKNSLNLWNMCVVYYKRGVEWGRGAGEGAGEGVRKGGGG